MRKLKPWRGAGYRGERHYAVALDRLRMTFECPRGHRYVKDYAKEPKHRRPGELILRAMVSYWSRAKDRKSVV